MAKHLDTLYQAPSMTDYGLKLLAAIKQFKEKVRPFFYAVVLSSFPCPKCNSGLSMDAPGRCKCTQCAVSLDPTLEFQRCTCGGKLEFKRCHYTCSACRQVVPSRFLFDERLFEPGYFAEKMRESRERKCSRKKAIQRLLLDSRSPIYPIEVPPSWEGLDGFDAALEDFLEQSVSLEEFQGGKEKAGFDLQAYRKHLVDAVDGCVRRFEAFLPLLDDRRLDRVFRFVALVYLWHEGLVQLRERAGQLWVEG